MDSPPIERLVGGCFCSSRHVHMLRRGPRETSSPRARGSTWDGGVSSGLGTSPSRCTAGPSSGVVAWLQVPSKRIQYLRVDGVDRPGGSLERAWNGPLSASRQVVEVSSWCKMRLPGGVERSCISALWWTGRNRRRRGETRTLASWGVGKTVGRIRQRELEAFGGGTRGAPRSN